MRGPIRPSRVDRAGIWAHGHLALPADPRAAQQARAFLTRELGALLDDDAMATVVLLASELVTNAVIHAASSAEVFWDDDGVGITVGVRDADTGPLGGGSPGRSDLAESGRGLLIVDGLSQSWGTVHANGRKTIWFRVLAHSVPTARDGGPDAAPARDPTGDPAAEVASDGRAAAGPGRVTSTRPMLRLQSLLLPEPVRQMLPYRCHVTELLARLVDAVGAAGGTVASVTGKTLDAYGDVHAGGVRSYPLALAGRALGTLHVHLPGAPPDDEVDAFLRIGADRLSVLAYEQGVLQAEHGRAEELDFLSEATEMLTATLNVRMSLTLLPQLVVPRLAEWAVVYVVDEGYPPARVAANHVHEDAVDALCEQLDGDPAFVQALHRASRETSPIRLAPVFPESMERHPVTVLPISSSTRTLAVLVLGRPPAEGAALSSLVELVRRAALAVDITRLHEEQARAATALQAALLPSALPIRHDVDIAARYHSASPGLMVGGDFYDAFELADGSLVCAVGDACGKGAEAASVTGMSRDLIRLLVRDGSSLPAALRRLNRSLLEDAGGSRFCTVALTRVETVGDTLTATVCLAGHPEPVLRRCDGRSEVVGTPGDLLGVLAGEIEVTEVSVRLEPGDALVLYTDGVTERHDGERMFGQRGVRETLEQADGGDAAELAESLENAARSFVDVELRDDLAILVLRRRP